MALTYLMGLDAGGGGARCVLVPLGGGSAVTTFRAWSHRPVPGSGGWAYDIDLAAAWRLVAETVHEALTTAGAGPGDVAGIGVCSMRHGMVVVDAQGDSLLAVPNRDGRAASEGMELADERGEEFLGRTGHWPNPVFVGARLLWLFRQQEEVGRRAAAVLALNEWVNSRLCGERAADPTQAAESLLFDLRAGDWAWDLIESLGLPRGIFPEPRPAGTRLGGLESQAASILGLRAGIPIAMGGADTQCALLALGTVEPGQVAAVAGTTTPVQRVLAEPMIDPTGHLWTGVHVVPGRWVLESNAGSTGEALDWYARLLFGDDPRPVERLLAEAAEAPLGSSGFLSTLGAAVMNGRELGLPIGSMTFSHLTSGPGGARPANLARAMLEGMGYAIRANLEQLLALDSATIEELRVGGGLSRSRLWLEILSDVMRLPVRAPVTIGASAFGAAICAGVGAGVYPHLMEGVAALSPEGGVIEPDVTRSSAYRDLYQGWSGLRLARRDADDLAAAHMLQNMSADEPEPGPAAAGGFRPKVLVTAELDEASLERLRRLGEVEYASYREAMRLLSGPELVGALSDRQVFVTEIDVLDGESLVALPNLRLVFACRGNVVNVDVAACTALGIPVLSAPGRNAEAVADLTLGFMLMLSRQLPEASSFLRQPGGEAGDMARMGQAHEQLRGIELWGKTVGLIGLGAVGRGVAERLRPFGARLLVFDPYLREGQAARLGVETTSLEGLLERSDIISLHAPVTDETRGMIGAKALGRMKPGALLINTARAALVDEGAVVEALHAGRLGGLGTDVFAVEPPGTDDPLLLAPNVIATPHIGGNTAEVATHQGALVALGLEQMMRGLTPANVLNPEALEGFSWDGPRVKPPAEVLERLKAGPGPAVTDLEQKDRAEAPTAAVEKPGLLARGLARLRGGSGEPPSEEPAAPSAASSHAQGGAPMDKIVQAFLHSLVQDPVMVERAKGQGLTIHYVLTEPVLEFYMAFGEGKVSAALGAPAEPAEVRLKMKGEIFDKMLTGEINATKAAMTGKLSFSGDTRKAMGMQRVQNDMMRLYQRARQAVGPPTFAPAAAPTPPQPVPAVASTVVAPAVVGDERDDMVAVIRELYATGLITATGGNISVRVEGKDELWITPSALFKGDLRPELMVRIGMDGETRDPEAKSPSSEWRMHAAVMQARPEVEAVIHAHAPQATVLGMSGLPFLPISTEAAFLGDVPRVPFIMPGTQELADAVAAAIRRAPAVLMQNHGILVAASSLRRAADQAEVLERTSEVILGCYAVGKEPPVLPDDVLATLREVGKMMA